MSEALLGNKLFANPSLRGFTCGDHALADERLILDFAGAVRALVDFASREVCVFGLRSDVTGETLQHFWADLALPALLAHEGALVIHAGAICSEGMAFAFLGNSGFGKSTLTASFGIAGFEILSDDSVIAAFNEGTYTIEATYSGLRLLTDSLNALVPSDAATSPVAHYTDKKRIDSCRSLAFTENAFPLATVFVLAEPDGSNDIRIRPMSSLDHCIALLASSFALNPGDKVRAQSRLEQVAAMANRVPAFELCYPRDYARLPMVREAILRQVSLCRATN